MGRKYPSDLAEKRRAKRSAAEAARAEMNQDYLDSLDSDGPRTYTLEEARRYSSESSDGNMVKCGWLWRAPLHNVNGWKFLANLDDRSGSFPPAARFLPVFVPQAER